MCTPVNGGINLTNFTAGGSLMGDDDGIMPTNTHMYLFNAVTGIFNYNPEQDAWIQLGNSNVGGNTYGAGSCGGFYEWGYGGTAGDLLAWSATAGTTNTLTTAKTIVKNLSNHVVRVVSGAGIGYIGTIATNTIGPNSVITLNVANGVTFDATTRFRMITGSLWFFNGGSTSVGLSVYDIATATWTALSVVGLPTAWGTNGTLVITPSVSTSNFNGTAIVGSTTNTLNTALSLPVNSVANYQVRITSGTGKGQIRSITSSTVGANTILTVSAVWTIIPDATSAFSIEGDDNTLFLLGNNAVAMYRYTIGVNTWSTITPIAARGGSASNGATASWVNGLTDLAWSSLTPNTVIHGTFPLAYKQNGRYIYAFRGGNTGTLDVYDIALNTWMAFGSTYGNAGSEVFTTGSCAAMSGDYLYIQRDATGRIHRFDFTRNTLEPWAANLYPQGSTVEGDKMSVVVYRDGTTAIRFLYTMNHSRAELQRVMVID